MKSAHYNQIVNHDDKYFFRFLEQEPSTEATTTTTTTASGVKVVGNFFEPLWVKVVIGVSVFLFLIVLTFVLYKTCKKEGGKYEVQK